MPGAWIPHAVQRELTEAILTRFHATFQRALVHHGAAPAPEAAEATAQAADPEFHLCAIDEHCPRSSGKAMAAELWGKLPPELFPAVLDTVPARAQYRFQAVCKTWCSLLSSQAFRQRSGLRVLEMGTPCLVLEKPSEAGKAAEFERGRTRFRSCKVDLPLPAAHAQVQLDDPNVKVARMSRWEGGMLMIADIVASHGGKVRDLHIHLVNPANRTWTRLPVLHHTWPGAGYILDVQELRSLFARLRIVTVTDVAEDGRSALYRVMVRYVEQECSRHFQEDSTTPRTFSHYTTGSGVWTTREVGSCPCTRLSPPSTPDPNILEEPCVVLGDKQFCVYVKGDLYILMVDNSYVVVLSGQDGSIVRKIVGISNELKGGQITALHLRQPLILDEEFQHTLVVHKNRLFMVQGTAVFCAIWRLRVDSTHAVPEESGSSSGGIRGSCWERFSWTQWPLTSLGKFWTLKHATVAGDCIYISGKHDKGLEAVISYSIMHGKWKVLGTPNPSTENMLLTSGQLFVPRADLHLATRF